MDNGKVNGKYYSIQGLYWDNGKKKMESTIVYRVYIWIMEK